MKRSPLKRATPLRAKAPWRPVRRPLARESARRRRERVVRLSDAQTRVDAAVAQKGWQIFMLHKLAATAADSITWAESDFVTLLAYCKTQGIAVKTMSEVINSMR